MADILFLGYALLAVLLLVVANALVRSFLEARARQRLLHLFGQYAPPQVVESLDKRPKSPRGEARELTVLFADIRNFTAISEQMEAGLLMELLNAYFLVVTDILHRHGATLDKYMGDGVMAFWGASSSQPDHAQRAVVSAIDIQKALVDLRREFRAKGWPEITVGIGINTGIMQVGYLGSRLRLSYTVIGDAVNLAFRLERLTRTYDAPIIVSESTQRAFPEMSFRELGLVEIKGKPDATRIYEPIGSSRPSAL